MKNWEKEIKGLEIRINNREDDLKKLKAVIGEIKRIQRDLQQKCEKDIEQENEDRLNELLILLEKNKRTAKHFLRKIGLNGNDGEFDNAYKFWKIKLHSRCSIGMKDGTLENYPSIKVNIF